jgi:hypothetical protein
VWALYRPGGGGEPVGGESPGSDGHEDTYPLLETTAPRLGHGSPQRRCRLTAFLLRDGAGTGG